MPNQLSDTGLTIASQTEIVSDLTTAYTQIYGADINLGSNTPDGQIIQIYATVLEDNLQLLNSVYNSFSLANAFGVQVDNLIAINGMQRQNGTQTVAYVNVVATLPINLVGLNAGGSTPFTVADQSGNMFQLQTSYSFSGPGNATLAFVSENIGAVLTSPNTITSILTPIVGIVSVNNPSTASDIIGITEESDQQCKVRQAQSLAMGAVGPADALRAQILNIPGVADAFVPENENNSVTNGIPANGIWPIVNAPGVSQALIAQVIYTKKMVTASQLFTATVGGTTTSGSAVISSIDTTGMTAGMIVSGTGIPTGSIISLVNSATEITINQNATASGAVTLTVSTNSFMATAVSYNITRPAGNLFTAWWSNAVPQPLYIAFQILPINGIDQFNTTALAASLASTLTYRLNQSAFIGDIIRAKQTIAPNGYLQNVFVGTASPANQQLAVPLNLVNYFTVSSANITITT